MQKLTIRRIEAMAKGQELRCVETPGLYVTFSGRTRTFGYQYRQHGQRRRVTLGLYPSLTLEDARRLAEQMRDRIRTGTDPARLAPAATVANAFERYRTEQLAAKRSGGELGRVLEQEMVSRFGGMRMTDLLAAHIADMHDQIAGRGCAVLANRAVTYARAFLNWAKARGMVDDNPAAGARVTTRERSRERYLSDAELANVWLASLSGVPSWYGRVVRLLVLTGCRRSEIAEARAEWLVGNALRIPAEHYKTGVPHNVPLTALAVEQIPDVKTGPLFPSATNWARYKRQLDAAGGVDGWTLHDLRRTFVVLAQRFGYPLEVVEDAIGHRSGTRAGVAGIYARHRYEDRVRELAEAVSAHVAALAS